MPKNFRPKTVGLKKNWVKKKLGSKIVKKNVVQRIKVQNNLGPKKNLFQNDLGSKNILSPQHFGYKNLGKMIWFYRIEVNFFWNLALKFGQN